MYRTPDEWQNSLGAQPGAGDQLNKTLVDVYAGIAAPINRAYLYDVAGSYAALLGKRLLNIEPWTAQQGQEMDTYDENILYSGKIQPTPTAAIFSITANMDYAGSALPFIRNNSNVSWGADINFECLIIRNIVYTACDFNFIGFRITMEDL